MHKYKQHSTAQLVYIVVHQTKFSSRCDQAGTQPKTPRQQRAFRHPWRRPRKGGLPRRGAAAAAWVRSAPVRGYRRVDSLWNSPLQCHCIRFYSTIKFTATSGHFVVSVSVMERRAKMARGVKKSDIPRWSQSQIFFAGLRPCTPQIMTKSNSLSVL